MERKTYFSLCMLFLIWYSGATWGWGYKLLSNLTILFVVTLTYATTKKED